MKSTQNMKVEGSPGTGTASHRATSAIRCRQCCDPECRDDHQIVGMRRAFHATGGLLPLDRVSALFRRHGGPHAEQLSAWIATRTAIAFEWSDDLWLPMFQFSRKALSVHAALCPVLQELSAIYDGWATAAWFALPNTWLGDRAPVNMLTHDLSAVRYAARLDRFIALGEGFLEEPPLDAVWLDSRQGVPQFQPQRRCHTRSDPGSVSRGQTACRPTASGVLR